MRHVSEGKGKSGVRASVFSKSIIAIPVALGFVAGVALTMGRLAAINIYPREMLEALLTNLLASGLALIPVRLTRGTSQVAVIQGALVATMVQMMVAAAMSGVVIVGFTVHSARPFVFWVIPLYWMCLTLLVVSLVSTVKHSAALSIARSTP